MHCVVSATLSAGYNRWIKVSISGYRKRLMVLSVTITAYSQSLNGRSYPPVASVLDRSAALSSTLSITS